MITIVPVLDGKKRWIDITEPSKEEITRITKEYSLPQELIEHSLDKRERPRIDEQDDITLVILRVPAHKERGRRTSARYETAPVGFLLRADSLSTISHRPTSHFLQEIHHRAELHKSLSRIMLAAFSRIAEEYLSQLEVIEEAIDRFEASMTSRLENREVLDLLKHQRTLVDFTAALRANEFVLERLQRVTALHLSADEQGHLEDILVEYKQASEVSALLHTTLSSLAEVFSSLISNDLNLVMKRLTAAGVLVSFPLFLVGLYGMNVSLPGASSPAAFWGLLLSSLLGSILLYFLLRWGRLS